MRLGKQESHSTVSPGTGTRYTSFEEGRVSDPLSYIERLPLFIFSFVGCTISRIGVSRGDILGPLFFSFSVFFPFTLPWIMGDHGCNLVKKGDEGQGFDHSFLGSVSLVHEHSLRGRYRTERVRQFVSQSRFCLCVLSP